MQEHLKEWELLRNPAGYRWVQQFEARPDQEQIDDALASSTDGLRQKLGGVDRFIDDLRG